MVQLALAIPDRSVSTARSNILVTPPDAGQDTNTVAVKPGTDLVIAFEPATANVSLDGTHLVFTFADGLRTVLTDFVDAAPDVNIVLPSGTVLPGSAILAELVAWTAAPQVETAAGPEAPIDADSDDDILVAMQADDVTDISGTTGDDVFALHADTAGITVVHGFDVAGDTNPATDVLDISDLLTVDPGDGPLSDFITITNKGAGALVYVDGDGAGGGTPVALLLGVAAGDVVNVLLDMQEGAVATTVG